MKKIAGLFIAVLLLAGCVSQQQGIQASPGPIVGGDADAHSCIGSAGYSWCEQKQKCVRPWEENCTASSGNFRILTEEFPPYNLKDASGRITGASTEVVQEILRRTNQAGEIELMNFTDAYELALKGPKTLLYSAGRTPQRENLFKWAGTIGSWEQTLYASAKSNASISSLEDAKKAGKICVVENDVRHQLLAENNFTNFEAVQEDGLCAEKLVSGEADLWFGSSTSFKAIVGKANLGEENFKPVYAVRKSELYIAFSRDVGDETVAEWQNALDAMKKDGTFDAILWNYGLPAGAEIGTTG